MQSQSELQQVLLCKNWKVDAKLIMKCKESSVTKTILKKNKSVGLTLRLIIGLGIYES